MILYKMYCIEHKDNTISMFIDKTLLKKCIDTGENLIVCSDCGRELLITNKLKEMLQEIYNE